ncbi:MAG: VCBS repeat-containing protein [Acidimicrobiales bacterium]|nr:VCBS repeat-containing protein [Acidimicrobiales bacterium]
MLAPMVMTARATAVELPLDNFGGWDKTFSGDGHFDLDLARGSDGVDEVRVDNLGRVVMSITYETPPRANGYDSGAPFGETGVVRLLPNGMPDATWGSGGVATLTHPEYPTWAANVVDIALNPLGGVDVMTYDAWVMRLDASGATVRSFGARGDGWVETRWPNAGNGINPSHGSFLRARPGGGVFVLGMGRPTNADDRPFLTALTADGELDPAFGDGGRILVPSTTTWERPFRSAGIAVRADGTAIVALSSERDPDELKAIRSDGVIDETFGVAGRVELPPTSTEVPMAMHASGEVTLVTQAGLARYRFDGAFDGGFGDEGLVAISPVPTTIQAQGESVVALRATLEDARTTATVVRRLEDGSADPSLGTDGRVDRVLPQWQTVAGFAAAPLGGPGPDLVIAGATNFYGRRDVALRGLSDDGTNSSGFGDDGEVQRDYSTWGRSSTNDVTPDGEGGFFLLFEADGTGVLHIDASGTLDPAFGDDGIQWIHDRPFALDAAPDGGVYLYVHRTPSYPDRQTVAVRRLNSSGAIDPAFNDGEALLLPASASEYTSAVQTLALLDGRVVFAMGQDATAFTPDGRLDPTAGPDGTFDLGTPWGVSTPHLTRRGAGFLAAHTTSTWTGDRYAVKVVMRAFATPGVVDASFGIAGTAEYDGLTLASSSAVIGVEQNAAGIYVATQSQLLRFLPNGTIDVAFKPITIGDYLNPARQFGIESTGRLLVNTYGATVRYGAGGGKDRSFGVAGVVGNSGFRVVVGDRLVSAGGYGISMHVRDGLARGGVPELTSANITLAEGVTKTVTFTLDRAPDSTSTNVAVKARIPGSTRRPRAYVPIQSGNLWFKEQAVSVEMLYPDDEVGERPSVIELLLSPERSSVLVRTPVVRVATTNNDPARQPSGMRLRHYLPFFLRPFVMPTQESIPTDDYFAGVNVAAGDIDGDGADEAITALRDHEKPWVSVTSFQGDQMYPTYFLAYDASFRGGVNVAAGDLQGDGAEEVVTAPSAGMSSVVKIFRYGTDAKLALKESFLAYPSAYKGGAVVGTADVDGDGRDEILTAPGAGAVPSVKIWKRGSDGVYRVTRTFLAYASTFRGGLTLAAADVDGDGKDEIVTGAGPGGAPHVRVFSARSTGVVPVAGFYAYSTDFTGGVVVSGGNVDADKPDEIVTVAGPGGGPHVRFHDIVGGVHRAGFGYMATQAQNYLDGATAVPLRSDYRTEDVNVLTGWGGRWRGAAEMTRATVHRLTYS